MTVKAAATAVLLSVLYGAFDEVHQSFTPGRSPDVRDLFADGLGAALGVAARVLAIAAIARLDSRLDAGGRCTRSLRGYTSSLIGSAPL